ncbi:MAG: GAF domain-containing protein [Thermoanaerobaculaceae bacterium]|nr:GAF domain-containing protein [Thermoanaerobaculaceae bacterium]
MPHDVLITEDVAPKTARACTVIRPGAPVARGVVVASAASLSAWEGAATGDAIWIVLGDGPGSRRCFLLLPSDCTGAQLDAAIDAAAEVLRLREGLAANQRQAARARDQQLDLVRVGIALTAERDLERLLGLILTTGRELVRADAGSLYLIEERDGRPVLRFTLAQNDSVGPGMVAATMPVSADSLAGYVAAAGEPVTVEDVRRLPADAPFRFNPSFDLAIGYHTRSVLTAPIATRGGQVIGVLQLINRKTDAAARILSAAAADASVGSFGEGDVALIRALAAQAAVAIENTRLVQEIENLFEGFVRAAVVAIEQRDPTTSGHSLRVADYTVALARSLEASPPPRYRGVRFDRDAITRLRYASLLHDFGKVGVREAVLTKAKKLHPDRLALVQERFRHAARAQEVRLLRRLLATLAAQERVPAADDLAACETAVGEVKRELDAHLAALVAANEPSLLGGGDPRAVAGLQRLTFCDRDGAETPLLLPEEARALAVARGSLDEAERHEVESHVVHSYQFLLTIPWPKRLAGVPALAYGHHEKLDGRGYPNRLTAGEIPLEVRMMTVADIYDALTVGDRPYKRAVPRERALAILEGEAAGGSLDGDLVRLFIAARLWARTPSGPPSG